MEASFEDSDAKPLDHDRYAKCHRKTAALRDPPGAGVNGVVLPVLGHIFGGRLRQKPEDGLAFSQDLPIQHQSGLGQSKSKTCYLKLESKIRCILGSPAKCPCELL